MKYFDTHAHYNYEVYNDILEDVMQKNLNTGVKYIVNASYDVGSSYASVELSKKFDYIYAGIGIHPTEVRKNNIEDILELYKKEVENNNKKIVAIGEIGLDYYYTKEDKELQKKFFCEQIELANYLKLPILIHTREAALDTYNVILKEKRPETKVLFHCFSPTQDFIRLVLDRGYTVAYGGNITYKRRASFEDLVRSIPLSNVVLETDSPFLIPIPCDKKPNASYNLEVICKKLANIYKLDEEEVSDTTFNNAIDFFDIKNK